MNSVAFVSPAHYRAPLCGWSCALPACSPRFVPEKMSGCPSSRPVVFPLPEPQRRKFVSPLGARGGYYEDGDEDDGGGDFWFDPVEDSRGQGGQDRGDWDWDWEDRDRDRDRGRGSRGERGKRRDRPVDRSPASGGVGGGFFMDLYERLFWYGTDELDRRRTEDIFGGTRGNFNGLRVLNDIESKFGDGPGPGRDRRRGAPSQRGWGAQTEAEGAYGRYDDNDDDLDNRVEGDNDDDDYDYDYEYDEYDDDDNAVYENEQDDAAHREEETETDSAREGYKGEAGEGNYDMMNEEDEEDNDEEDEDDEDEVKEDSQRAIPFELGTRREREYVRTRDSYDAFDEGGYKGGYEDAAAREYEYEYDDDNGSNNGNDNNNDNDYNYDLYGDQRNYYRSDRRSARPPPRYSRRNYPSTPPPGRYVSDAEEWNRVMRLQQRESAWIKNEVDSWWRDDEGSDDGFKGREGDRRDYEDRYRRRPAADYAAATSNSEERAYSAREDASYFAEEEEDEEFLEGRQVGFDEDETDDFGDYESRRDSARYTSPSKFGDWDGSPPLPPKDVPGWDKSGPTGKSALSMVKNGQSRRANSKRDVRAARVALDDANERYSELKFYLETRREWISASEGKQLRKKMRNLEKEVVDRRRSLKVKEMEFLRGNGEEATKTAPPTQPQKPTRRGYYEQLSAHKERAASEQTTDDGVGGGEGHRQEHSLAVEAKDEGDDEGEEREVEVEVEVEEDSEGGAEEFRAGFVSGSQVSDSAETQELMFEDDGEIGN